MKIRFLILYIYVSYVVPSFTQENTNSSVENFRLDEAKLDSAGVFTFWGIYFNLGTYSLLDTSTFRGMTDHTAMLMRSNEVRLMTLADYLFRNPGFIIEVGVHNDCLGSSHSCRLLSQRRAETICDTLTALGVEADRLIAKGFESSRPYLFEGELLTCEYISQFSKLEQVKLHQKNKRFEIRILSKDYVRRD